MFVPEFLVGNNPGKARAMSRKIILAIIVILAGAAQGQTQSSTQEPTNSELQKQLQEMRSLVTKLENRVAELEAAKGTAAANSGPDPIQPIQPNAIQSDPIQPQSQTLPQHAAQLQPGEAESTEGPTALHFKGLTVTPGGFLESTVLVRTRNENADISTTYSAIPLNGSSNANLTELRGSARNSQLSLLVQGSEGGTTLKGYVETDFMGAAPTANYVQSSSFTPRLRQLWVQFDKPSGLTITLGQMWSLLTTNEHGIENLQELRPIDEDGNYVVGFTWTRERAFRVTQNFNNKVWAGFAVENPESTYSAAFVPANVMGLNTSPNAATGVNLLPYLANYSNGQSTTLAPDLVAKIAYEPGWGHFEVKALGRFFRDRIAATATTDARTNITGGYGVGFAAVMPFENRNVELSLEGLAGQGIGRYGASGLPDVTLNPITGEMLPLRQARVMGGVVYHHGRRLDLYAYGGDEYTGRYASVSPTGTAAGYGSPLVSYSSCTYEVALNSCDGANRNIYEVTAGYWYRLYQGEYGSIEQGNQVLYIHRNLWSGIGTAPQGGDVVAYTTLRFYLP
jgi:hypothetical protein